MGPQSIPMEDFTNPQQQVVIPEESLDELPAVSVSPDDSNEESVEDTRMTWLILCVIILIFAGIILVAFSISWALRDSYTKEFTSDLEKATACTSNSCADISKMIQTKIYDKVRPCDNFYNFVCKKESFKEPVITSGYMDLIFKLITSLQTDVNENSPDYLRKLKQYYESCIEDSTDMQHVRTKVNQVMMPYKADLSWIEINKRMYKIGIPANFMVKVSIKPDFKNNSRKMIYLDQPSFTNTIDSDNIKSKLNDIDSSVLYMHKESMIQTFKMFRKTDEVDEEFHASWNIEEKLINISRQSPIDNLWSLYDAMAVHDLEQKYPSIKWLDFINGIIEPIAKINRTESIYISRKYLEEFEKILFDLKKSSNQVLVNYLLLRASHFLSGDNKVLKNKNIPYQLNRRIPCMISMNNRMPLATSALYLKKSNSSGNFSLDHKNINVLVKNIRDSFQKIIQNATWLDDIMRHEISNKIHKMNILVGYPNELLNDTKLNDYYKDLDFSRGPYMYDLLSLEKFKLKQEIESLRKPYNKTHWTQDYGKVVSQIAYYSSENVVFIPGGMLDSWFYYKNVPSYVNYAMIGYIIGHEIAHSLNANARYYDLNGNYNQDWWKPNSSTLYSNKTQCIVDKYNNYKLPDVNLHINGTLTLNENMADINGMKSAYEAYSKFLKYQGLEENNLPGFNKYTSKQLFWITWASTWCYNQFDDNKVSMIKHLTNNPHSPMMFRINGVATSIPEFGKDFNCTSTDPMNPTERCSLWL